MTTNLYSRSFQSRTLGLSASSGRLLRDYTKPTIESMRGFARSRYGLAEWSSIPPKAHHFYHIIHKYGTFDSTLRGFGQARLPPVSEGLRDLLLAIERVYSSCGRAVPPIETLRPVTSTDPVVILDDITSQIFPIIEKASKDALQLAARSLGKGAFITFMGGTLNWVYRNDLKLIQDVRKGISDALKRLADICQSMSSLFENAAGDKPTSSTNDSDVTSASRGMDQFPC